MMLQAIKGKAMSWVIRVFAVLLIISFGAWGVGDMITGGGLPTEVAEVGETKISAREFNRTFREEMERSRRILGAQLDSQQARQLGLADAALDGLIDRRLISLEAEDLGLLVGDDQIRQQVRAQAAFRNQMGQFDNGVYRQVLQRNGLTEQRYIDGLRGDLTRSHLTGVIDAGSVAPVLLAEQLYRYRNETRVAELVVVTRASSPTPPSPGDADLRAYHRDNAGAFTAPEMRDITALHLDPAKLAEEIRPSAGQIKDAYDDRLSSLSIPERRRMRQILARDEAMARRAIDRLRTGTTVSKVAKELAGQDDATTRLGLVIYNDLPRALAEAAFKLAENKPSEPIETPLGWHVLVAEKIEPGKTPTLGEVREKIAKELARELAVDGLIKLANQLEDNLAGGGTLEQAAAELNARIIRLRGIDATGRTPDGKIAEDLPKAPQFLETAFTVETSQTSDLSDTPDGGYFILRVDTVTPPALRPFETVRGDIAKAWTVSRRDAAAREKADEILSAVKAGAALTAEAAQRKLTVTTSKPFTRFGRTAGSRVPPALVARLFRVDKGGAAMTPSNDGYAVAQVKTITAANPAIDKPGYDQLRSGLRAAMANDLLDQFSMALRQSYPVSIDRGAVDRLFNAGGFGR